MSVDGEHLDQGTGTIRSPKHGGRSLASSVLRFDLGSELSELRQQQSYERGGPGGKTLVKGPDLRIVLMALKAGGRFQEHSASGPVSIQAIEGRMRIHVLDDSVELSAGALLALQTGIRHDVDGIDDCAFLLTIGRTTYDNVSDHHEPAT